MSRHLSISTYVILPLALAGAAFPLFGGDQPVKPRSQSSAKVNEPPVCLLAAPEVVGCQGLMTVVPLDASASFDPEGASLEYLWTTNCGQFSDPTSPSPLLLADTSSSCDYVCSIRVRIFDGVRYTFCRTFVRFVGEVELDLDVKPTSCPNPIQVGSNGVVPVSLLGTSSFDIATVDVTTLLLGRADGTYGQLAPIDTHVEDTGTPFTGDLCDCHELGADGFLDLGMKFDKEALVAALGLENDPNFSFVAVRLTGELTTGELFFAEDCIRVQGN